MRIIAGQYRSLKLERVESDLTRETSDKVRGAVFNSLGEFVNDADVLDLFAGSGAYGLEALSRGAKDITFVDNQAKAIQTVKNNIKRLKTSNTQVIQGDYFQALNQFKNSLLKFDLVMIDPPYQFDDYHILLDSLISLLKPNARIVVESSKNTKFEQLNQVFIIYKEATYGIKKITYIEYQK